MKYGNFTMKLEEGFFFLRKIEYEEDFEFDYMAKFELDSEKFSR